MEEKICNKKLYEIINDFAIAAESLQIDKIFSNRVDKLISELEKYKEPLRGWSKVLHNGAYELFDYQQAEIRLHLITVNIGMAYELDKHRSGKLKLHEQKVNLVTLPYFLSKSRPNDYGTRLMSKYPSFQELWDKVYEEPFDERIYHQPYKIDRKRDFIEIKSVLYKRRP